MFQELLLADLVVADLSIDNPNVWYELGVRHALRARGVVLVSGGRVTTAFDLYTDRKLRYGIKDGGPDPATVEDDKRKLAEMVKATMESWHGRKVSPVYNLMPNLQEPDWKSLRIGDVREFWEQHDEWQNRLDLARKAGRIGDVLVLAEEAPVAAFRAEAWIKAGEALRKAERFRFALERLERGLAIDPENLRALREQGMCLQRLAVAKLPGYSLDRAREHYGEVLKRYPTDPETWALLGRVDKDAWVDTWNRSGRTPERSAATLPTRTRCCAPRSTATFALTAATRTTTTPGSTRWVSCISITISRAIPATTAISPAGPDSHPARRTGPAAEGRRSLRSLQSLAAVLGARLRHRQGPLRRAMERRRWRRPRRHSAHVPRGQAPNRQSDLAGHAYAVVTRPGLAKL